MTELANEIRLLIRERIIVTIKRYGAHHPEGYKIDFAVFTANYIKDEVVSKYKGLKIFPVTEANIFSFFKGQSNTQLQLISEKGVHYLYLKPKGPINSKEIKAQAKIIAKEVFDQKKRVSYKYLYNELSRRIVFFEYQLNKTHEPIKEYIQQLIPTSVSDGETGKQNETNESTLNNQTVDIKTDNESDVSNSILSPEEADEIVRKDILRIIKQQGIESGGCSQIVLGTLVNELVANLPAYQVARGNFKGPARSYLLDRFGDILTIEYIDGKDCVRVSLSSMDEQAKGKKNKSVEEEKTFDEPPVIQTVSITEIKQTTSTKTTKAATKRKEKAEELLIQELSTRNDEELRHIFLVMQLVHETTADETVKTAKKKAGSVASKNESSGVGGAAERILLNVRAVLAQNDVMNQIMASMTTGEIVDVINREIRMRTGETPVSVLDRKSAKTFGTGSKNNNSYSQEVQKDVDFEGLDDWLPF